MMVTMKEWFGLAEPHNDFTIETEGDREEFFGRSELQRDLSRRLARSFRTDNPPKMVLYGEWGSGKTHTMRHLQYELEHGEQKAISVFVELPDITKKSTFQVAHSALLDAFGLQRASNWILQYAAMHPDDAQQRIQEFGQSSDIATALFTLFGAGEGVRVAWDWLRGIKVKDADARMVGLPPVMEQSGNFVRVLQILGRLAREVEDSMLVFMLDEATKLAWVTDDDAVAHWTNAFKLLADDSNKEVGFIVSISVTDIDFMARPLHDQQVVTRFGDAGYVLLKNLNEEQARGFISSLVSTWTDAEARAQLMAEYAEETDGERISDESFPFTEPALHQTASWMVTREGAGYTRPRLIQKNLDELLNRAMDDGKHLISTVWLSNEFNR